MNASLVWTILLYGWTASEVYIAVATRTRRGGGEVSDRGSMFVLWITIFGSITAAQFARHLSGFAILGHSHMLRVAAIAIFAAGFAIRWAAIVSLGKAFSANVAIRDTQALYRSGLYGVVRHPSYTGMLIIFAAIGLETNNWISAAIVILFPAAALLYRIRVEEAALLRGFGGQYASYCLSTKRLIPGIY